MSSKKNLGTKKILGKMDVCHSLTAEEQKTQPVDKPEKLKLMDVQSLKTQLLQITARRQELSGPDFIGLRELLLQFKASGGTQEEAFKMLEASRAEVNEDQEDRILEIMDIVTGFCTPDRRIWHRVLL